MKLSLERRIYVGLSVVIVGWILLTLPTLLIYPSPYSDEAWISALSVNWLRDSKFEVGIFGGLPFYQNYLVFRFYNITLAQVFKLFGIGLWQARMFSAVGALAGGMLLFMIARRLFDAVTGLAAAQRQRRT